MQDKQAIQYKEGQKLLFNAAIKAVPFNVIMATGLAAYLFYSVGMQTSIVLWFCALLIVTFIRIVLCKRVVKYNLLDDERTVKFQLRLFFLLCMIAGLIWTSIYFLMLPYVTEATLYVIVLTFGGMVAGGTTSLAVWFPAFLAYTISIFIPPIIHTFSLGDLGHAILAGMWSLYLLALSLIATINKDTLKKVFFLTEQNEILAEKFEALSITDPLTGLYNRRHFSKSLADEYNLARTNRKPFAVVSIDIDYFKLINDNFGHTFGDNFIIYTANFLRHHMPVANNLIFRLGGDEFIALMLDISEEATKKMCSEIVTQFKNNPKFEYDRSQDKHKIIDKISMSIGVVYVPSSSQCSVEQIIEKADQSLYQSKNQGKNQISFVTCV